MIRIGILMLFGAAAIAADGPNLVPNPRFEAGADGAPARWKAWSPRPEIAPRAAVVETPEGRALSIQAPSKASYGRWETVAAGIVPGKHYRFEVLRRAANVAREEVSVAAVLTWAKDDAGAAMIQRDYIDRIQTEGEWRRERRVFRAPEGARSVRIELMLRWAEGGSVLWRQPALVEVDAPPRRVVRVATTHAAPKRPATLESNREIMAALLDRAGAEKPDLIVLSENFAERGVDLPLLKRAEPVPGPATRMMSDKARRYRAWVVATLLEIDRGLVYNTAVLIDREGVIRGKYRKVHLPLAEGEEGITPGDDYPVFDTDFGRVGIATCWDNWFVETARILRLKGAEMILFPIAGDGTPGHWDVMSRARAIDNGVYLVSSNTVGGASRIVNPAGEVLAEASGPFAVAAADLDLDQEWRVHWLSVGPADGEGRSLYIKERRPETYGIFTEDAHKRAPSGVR